MCIFSPFPTKARCHFHIPCLYGPYDVFVRLCKPNGIAFYWISFCINFHWCFFSFLWLLLSSFVNIFCSLFFLCFCCCLLLCAFHFAIVSRAFVQYSRLYGIIYECPLRKRWFHKLFTSYTTKYRHRYIDTTWTWWCLVYVLGPNDSTNISNTNWICTWDYTFIEFCRMLTYSNTVIYGTISASNRKYCRYLMATTFSALHRHTHTQNY